MALIHNSLTSLFSDTANAIREKTNSVNSIVADNFPSEIRNINVGPNTQDATATTDDILSPKTAYVAGVKVTGNIPTLNASNLTVDGAKVTAAPGYYSTAVNKTVAAGAVVANIATHSITNPTVTVSHSGNIATIGTTTKPSGTAGTNYYQVGFTNSITAGSVNAQASGNISTNGYVTTSNNSVSAWSNQAVSADITQPATYYINKGTLTDAGISGTSYLENTGDYGFRATVVVPEGYHAGETVVKNFTTGIFPAPESKGTADKMLTGYSLYDEDGKLVTGSMPNQGAQNATISTQGGTYTIPAGYHNGSGVITASLGSATINAPAGSKAQSKPTFTWDETNKLLTASVAATSGTVYANVTNAGYIGTGTKSGTFSMTASSNTYALDGALINAPSGSATQSTPSFSWDATNRKLTASVAATTGTVYANIESSGFADAGIKSGTFSMGASSNTYTMAAAAINAPSGSATQSTPGIEFNTITGVVTATVNATTGTAYANVTGAGYTGTGTKSGSFSLGASSNTYNIGIGSASTPATTVYTSAPTVSVTNSNGYVTVASASGTKSVTPDVTAGYISSGVSGVVTATVNATGLQLNTKAGGTTTVTSSETTLINAGQFAVGAIKAKAAAGALSKTAATATLTSDGLVTNIGNGAVNVSDAIPYATGANGVYRFTATGSGGANVTTAGYLAAGTANSNSTTNTYYIAKGTTTAQANSVTVSGKTVTYKINAAVTAGYQPAGTYWVNGTKSVADGSATTPATTVYTGPVGMTFNASNGVVTASSVSATQSVTPTVVAGYVESGTAGTITATSNANTYSVGLATLGKSAAASSAASDGLVTNISNGAVNASDKIAFATGANSTYRITTTGSGGAKITAAGYIAKDVANSNSTTNAYYINKGSATTPATTVYTGKVGMSFNASNGVVTASSVSGTASVTPTVVEGYIKAGTAGTITATSNANTYNVGLGSRTAGTQAFITAGLVTNISNGAVTATDNVKLTTGANGKYRINVNAKATTTAGYIAAGTSYDTAGATYINKATATKTDGTPSIAGTAASASATATGFTASSTATSYYVTASASANSGKITGATATATVSEGYAPSATTATATLATVAAVTNSASNTIYIPASTVSDFSAKYKQQSTPTVGIYANGLVYASSAATTQTIYRNVSAGYTPGNTTGITFTLNASGTGTKQLTTKAGGTTTITGNTKIVANQTFTTGDVYATVTAGVINTPSGSATQSKPTFSVANGTGIVTASVAATSGTAYRNITTAGYLATNTTGGTFTMSASSNTYQLNTKAGSTTYVDGAGATLVNAGQFVTGAIIAKAANVTYNSTSQTLTIPAGLVTVS